MKFRFITYVIIAAALLTPTVSANQAAEDYGIGEITVTGEGQVVPNYGYWVYGEVKNYEIYNIKEAKVEVTTYDAAGGLLDTLTTMVRPNIINAGTRAPFLVKSTVPNQVYDVKVRLVSYERTALCNMPYIEISNLSEVSEGKITGTVSNTHPDINLYEAEIIATFYDYQGNIDDVKTYGVNGYAQFDAGESIDFIIQSDIMTPYSVNLVTQCSMYYREPILYMNITDKTPVQDGDLRIGFDVYPKLPGSTIQITFYPPSGGAFPQTTQLYLDGTYYINMKPNEVGEWRVRMDFPPTLVNQSRGYVESAYIEDTFRVMKAPILNPSGTNETDSTGATETDDITEKVSNSIPGYPSASLSLGLAALILVYRRRNTYDI